jgi:tRNA-specific 2-thiouridylase
LFAIPVCSFSSSQLVRHPFLLQAASTNGEQHAPSLPVDESFQRVRILDSSSAQDANVRLVKLGLEFGSHRRRFRGQWTKSRERNVISYLKALGLNETHAQQQATRPCTQTYQQVAPGVFSIDTDNGRCVQVYSLEEWMEDVEGSVCRRTTWEGDVHVTTTKNSDGSTEITRRYLNFTSPVDWNLVVEREYRPTNAPTVECTEVFVREQSANRQQVSPLTRVPGCVANVQVRTTLLEGGLHLDGEADAVISRGLLCTLSRGLEGSTPKDVLALNPDSVADLLQLRHVLSKGRNDGLASMVRVVQNQVRALTCPSDNASELPEMQEIQSAEQTRPTVAVLLSGGVDSSVALNILKRQNFNVTAFYLKIWLEDELAHLGQCPWEDDYRVCEQVCAQAGVPLETISLQNEYKERVISYTVHEAERGRTPNPDIMCNSRVKFGCFYDAIQERGFDHVASGHYAQLESIDGQRQLLRAPDPIKDQSYFLCTLTQDQLRRVLFPIGHYQKSEVRLLAEEFDLPNKQRPDSQGLCFLGKVKFDAFLEAYLGECPGDIVDAHTGEVLGRHRGVWYHTVGQRKGIGKVLNPKATSRGPWYVVAKDPQHNIVFCSNEYDEEAFAAARSDFHVEDIQWISGSPPPVLLDESGNFLDARFHMKIRHGPTVVEGTLSLTDTTAGGVMLDKKDGGLAPGQYVAFYELDGLQCFGGGVISERHWAKFLLGREVSDNLATATP